MSANKKNGFRNFVLATLRVGTEPEHRCSENGTQWARLRASLYMGRERGSGKFRPSKWFTLKAFAKEDADDQFHEIVSTLGQLAKGDRVTVQGRLDYQEFTRKDETTGSEDIIVVTKVLNVNGAEREAEAMEQPA